MDQELERFVETQDQRGVYERALGELRAGRKRSHWMWFVFPQIAGLGQSAMSQRYAIESLEEARAYLEHPVLGPRLVECYLASPRQPLYSKDSRGLGEIEVFERVLERYFDGAPDEQTLGLL